MAKKPIRFFLDTNIISHYLVLLNLKGKEIGNLANRYKSCYELLDKIKTTKIFNFVVCSLSQAEIYYALYDEFRCHKMNNDGVPFSSWERNKWHVNLSEEEIKSIIDSIITFSFDFIYSKDDSPKKILSSPDINEPDIFSELIFKNKIRTHDAIIISTAICQGCKYLITNDKNLKDRLKNYKKIKLISPEEALKLIS